MLFTGYAVTESCVKIDAIPGRLNQFVFAFRSPVPIMDNVQELCGVGHGFMPIKIQFTKSYAMMFGHYPFQIS